MTGYLKQYSPLLQFVAFIGIFIGFMLLSLALLTTGLPLISDYTFEQLQNAGTADPKVVGYLKLIQFLYTFTVYLLPAWLFAYLADPQPLEWSGLHKSPKLLPVILSLLIMFSAGWAVGITAEWNMQWEVPQVFHELESQADKLTRNMLQMHHFGDLLLNLALIAVLPALAEELFFRGVLQRLIIQLVRQPWIGVLLTAILFSLVHLQMLSFLPRVVLGFLLGAIYLVSGNLWLSILGHFLNNGMQVVAVYLFQMKIINDDPLQSETVSWYVALISALVTLALLWVLHKRSRPPGEA